MQPENITPGGNRYWCRLDGVIEMELTQGKMCLLDEWDIETVRHLKWRAARHGDRVYAQAHAYREDGQRRVLSMHTLLMGQAWMGKAIHVDHRDGDGLNNRRSNLRSTGAHGNGANMKKPSTNTTGFKGVSLNPACTFRPFRALVQMGGKKVYSGQFATAEEASDAYDRECKIHFGEFARPNKR